MTDLTEQLKKGELLGGWYYIKAIDRFTFPFGIAFIRGKEITISFPHLLDDEIEQVLAKVPTYHEYLALQSDSLAKNEFDNEIDELNDTIDKLKGLLKVCRKWIGVERDFAVPNEKIILQQLLTKIDEVLK